MKINGNRLQKSSKVIKFTVIENAQRKIALMLNFILCWIWLVVSMTPSRSRPLPRQSTRSEKALVEQRGKRTRQPTIAAGRWCTIKNSFSPFRCQKAAALIIVLFVWALPAATISLAQRSSILQVFHSLELIPSSPPVPETHSSAVFYFGLRYLSVFLFI